MTTVRDPSHLGRGILTTLRDVLFEVTPEEPVKVSALAPGAPTPNGIDSSAALQVLRQAVEEKLGPATRELAVQMAGLAEVLPDVASRRRAALRVLALKGFGTEQLLLELDGALSALAARNDAFASKLAQRRTALEQQTRDAGDACRKHEAEAEANIARLQAELELARRRALEAGAERDEVVKQCQAESSELADKQLGFELAYQALRDEYQTLERQLATELR